MVALALAPCWAFVASEVKLASRRFGMSASHHLWRLGRRKGACSRRACASHRSFSACSKPWARRFPSRRILNSRRHVFSRAANRDQPILIVDASVRTRVLLILFTGGRSKFSPNVKDEPRLRLARLLRSRRRDRRGR